MTDSFYVKVYINVNNSILAGLSQLEKQRNK